jgi:hypothetical protein
MRLLFAALTDAFDRTQDRKQWEQIANWVLLAAALRSDAQSLQEFLDRFEQPLKESMPLNLAQWRTRVFILAGNKAIAKEALDAAVKVDPKFEQTEAYKSLETSIFNLSADEQGPGVEDRDGADLLRRIAIAGHEGNADEMHRLIRDALLAKGEAVCPQKGDSRLFVGAKQVYREALRQDPKVKSYGSYVTIQARGLLERGGYSAAEAERYRHVIGLDAPAPSEALELPKLRVGDIDLPEALTNFEAWADVPQGVFELRARQSQIGLGGGDPETFCRPLFDGRDMYVQSSRGMACLRKGSLAWSRAVPCFTVWDATHIPQYLGGVAQGVTKGNLVVARLALEGGMSLAAMNRDDGRVVWTYRPRNAVITSDPALWCDQICIQGRRAEHGGGTTLLLLVDAHTGREIDRFQVGSEPANTVLTYRNYYGGSRWGTGHIQVDYAHSMAAPVVAGDVVFLQPHSGVAAAFHLLDRGLLWVRVFAKESSRWPASCRRVTRPVPGRANVLLAPPEARQIMLIERSSGRLVAQDTTAEWTDICRAGDDVGVVLTRTHLLFRALRDLSIVVSEELPGLRVLAPLADGCLLFDKERIYLYAADGKRLKTIRYPRSVLPVGCDGRHVYGFRRDRPDRFGVLTAAPVGNITEPPMVAGPPIGQTNLRTVHEGEGSELPVFVRARSERGVVVEYRDFLTFMTGAEQRVWDLPVTRWSQIQQLGNTVAVAQFGHIDFYDIGSGKWQRRWPPFPLSEELSAHNMLRSGKHLYTKVIDRRGKKPVAMCYRVADEGRQAEPIARSPETWVKMGGDGDFFFHYWWDYWVVVHSLSSRDKPPMQRQYTQQQLRLEDGFRVVPETVTDKTWLLQRKARKIWRFDRDGKSEPVTVPGKGELWLAGNRYVGVEHGLLHMLQGSDRRDRGQYLFVRPTTGDRQVIEQYSGAEAPSWVQSGEKVYAIHRQGNDEVLASLTDFSGTGAIKTVRGNPVKGLGGWELERPVQIGSTIVYPFSLWTWRLGGYAAYVALQKAGTTELVFRPFPHFTQTLPLSERMGLFNDIAVDEAVLDACLNLNKRVGTVPCSPRPPAFVEGFLDDWEAHEFTRTPRGRFAVRCRREGTKHHWRDYRDRHWLAIEITDPAVVRLLAREGAEHHIDAIIANGAKAGFFQGSEGARKHGYAANSRDYWGDVRSQMWAGRLSAGGGDDQRMAYSVAPDGLGSAGQSPGKSDRGPIVLCQGRYRVWQVLRVS